MTHPRSNMQPTGASKLEHQEDISGTTESTSCFAHSSDSVSMPFLIRKEEEEQSFMKTKLYSSKSEVLSASSPALSKDSSLQYLRAQSSATVPMKNVGLVGRDCERLVLEQAYDRVCCRVQQAPSEIVLVEGESGAGKSALVSSLQDSVDREDMGLFVRGKYNLHASAPYEAFVEAATELCNAVIASKYYFEDVREHLTSVLGNEDDMQLLVNLFPSVKGLLGEGQVHSSMEHHEINPSHEFALKHFLQVFRTFWKAVASVHPVILFLDDLQWADTASREFLTELASDMTSTNLLIIGAFRMGQFQWSLMDSSSTLAHLRITDIHVGLLSQESVNEIVARAIKLQPEETVVLGEIVYEKTHGNAFFCWQFLDMLQASGLLTFSYRTNRWTWVADIAHRTDVTDNVGELLAQKITRLSTRAQTTLMLASCLGHSFDSKMLQKIVVSEDLLPLVTTPRETLLTEEILRKQLQEALEDAVGKGLIEATGKDKFKFCHDRVQQIAFSMIPEGLSREHLHSLLGRRLYELSENTDGGDWMLCAAVDLLTESVAVVEASQFSTVQLAGLCLEAGRRTRAKSAFMTAASYADRGYLLLEASNRWESNYSLCLGLRNLSAELHQSYGNHQAAVEVTSDIIKHAVKIEDKFSAFNVTVATLMAKRDSHGAIFECSKLLDELGVRTATKASRLDVAFLLINVKQLLKGRRASDLLDHPPMTDPKIIQASRILDEMGVAAWMTDNQELCSLTSLTNMRIALTYGISQYSPCSFAIFGSTLAHFGKFEQAYEYGRLALQSHEKYGTRETMPRTFVVIHAFLHHLREPILTSVQSLEQAHKAGVLAGALFAAGQCLVVRTSLTLFGPMRLDHLEAQIRGNCDFFRNYQLESCFPLTLPIFQLVLNLTGKAADPTVLNGEALDDVAFVQQHTKLKNLVPRVLIQNCRMILLVVLDELELAAVELQKKRLHAPSTHYCKCCDFFFCGLACLGLARKQKQKSGYYLRQARMYQKALRKFVGSGSVNCIPLDKLLEAEFLSLKRLSLECVLQAYRDAIRAASRCGFRICKALAFEKAGEYLLDQGDRFVAMEYLQNSWTEFSDYGALAKLTQMERKYESSSFSFDKN